MAAIKLDENPWEPVPWTTQLYRAPLKFVTQCTYHILTVFRRPQAPGRPGIRVVCISDTHSKQAVIPTGDVLIHAGDLCNVGSLKDLQEQIDWLNGLPFKHIIAIAGNHDVWLDPRSRAHLPKGEHSSGKVDWKRIKYLQHSTVTITFPDHNNRKLKLYGAPHIPACGGPENAFQYPRGEDAWSRTVPDDIDILVTHTPAKYYRDLSSQLGCEFLLKELWRVRPKLHVFGHVHAGYGREVLYWDSAQWAYENASRRPPPKSMLGGLLDIPLWWCLAEIVVYGLLGVVWTALWGGHSSSTTIVDASLTFRNTGKLGNAPQVVTM